jgi:hypothetical protein
MEHRVLSPHLLPRTLTQAASCRTDCIINRHNKTSAVLPCCSVTVFVDPLCAKNHAPRFRHVRSESRKRLIAGVIEAAFAGVDLGLTRLGASGRMANRDPLGIGFEAASHSRCSLCLCPLPLLRQGVQRFAFHRREPFFRAALSNETGGPARRFRDA